MFDEEPEFTLIFESEKVVKYFGWGNFLPHFLQSCTLNFHLRYPETPRLSPHTSASRTFFSKKLTYVCSSALNSHFPGKKRHLISITAMRQPKIQKSAVFAQLGPFYGKFVGAPPFLR